MFSTETYTTRRHDLICSMNKAGQSGLILLLGNAESSRNYPSNAYSMRQDSTFLYYCGLQRHDLAAVLDIDSGEVTLYGDDYTVEDFIWMGEQPTLLAQGSSVGIEAHKPLGRLYKDILGARNGGRTIHYLPPYRAHNSQLLSELLGVGVVELAGGVSEALLKGVVSMREIKSGEEIEEINRACNIGNLMHREAMRMARVEGVTEREIAGRIEGIALSHGAGVSFHSIVSQNGQTLHNHDHSGVLTNGRLLLVDAGAETTMNYCSDHTRTIPVGGRFTDKQRDIYNIVYRAIMRGQELVRAGVTYQSVQIEVAVGMVENLKELGLMKGDAVDAVMQGAIALLMPHGLGHQMGMDVHDMEDLGEKFVGYNHLVQRSEIEGLRSLRMGKKLKAGHVITVEPGVYFIPALFEKWRAENKCAEFICYDKVAEYLDFGGIRLENDLLVTEQGCRNLGDQQAPLSATDVENFMA